MKKNILLSLGMLLGASATMQAQVVMSEDFSAEQTKAPTEAGWYEFINTMDGDERGIENGEMHFYNSLMDAENYQRAIKFRNLPIKENTSYRVSFMLKGDNVYSLDGTEEIKSKARFSLMQGEDNLDMAFLASDGTQYVSDISYFQTPEQGSRKYTGMFYYTNTTEHKAWYAGKYPEKAELPDKWFLTLNVYSPGDYYIDNVVVEEANIEGVAFRDDVIRVDFGYSVNTAALLNGRRQVLLPNDCVKVKLNGEQVNVMTVELKSDGKFYIFLDDMYPGSAEDKVEVSFTNPEDAAVRLMYAEGKTPGGAVLNFTDEAAVYDENMADVFSFAFETPSLLVADPEDGSFNLPTDMKEFKLTFDKEVDCSKIVATLAGERLTVSPSEGYATELTFTRNGGALANGEYVLNVTKIYPTYILADDVYGEENITLNFGPVNQDPNDVAKVIWNDGFSVNNSIPAGWTVYSGGSKKDPAEGVGSGPRVMEFTSEGDFKYAFYFRTENATENDGYVQYGNEDAENVVTLQAGSKYQVSYQLANWSGGPYVKFEMFDADGNVVVDRIDATELSVPNTGASTVGAPKIEFTFRPSATGNYVFKWTPVADTEGKLGGWLGCLLANIQVKYMPNAAGVEETNLLNTALENAKAVLEANDGERYAGADYDALKAAIEKYDGKSFTAPSAYKNGAVELDAAAKAMKEHRSLCDTYDPLVDNAKYARDLRTGTKYERHASYAAIEEAIALYEGKVLTDNVELQEAITLLQNTTAAVTNIIRVVDTYTASMVSGLATLNKLGVENEALTAAVNDALTDDAAVKTTLKSAIDAAVNTILSNPNNDMFAEKVDPETLENYVDSFDMSVFIDNPELYCTAPDDEAGVVTTENTPGWTITPGEGWSGGFTYHYPWGANSQYKYNAETCPVADCMIASWTYSYDIEQTVTGLPAGTYTLYAGVGERGGNETPTSYIYANTADKENQLVVPVIAGSLEPKDNAAIENIVITDGKLTIGMHMDQADHTFLNAFHLIMKAPAEGYNYVDGIADVKDNGTVSRIEMYDLNGRRIESAARGVVIVKKTMTDGTVVTEKKVVK